MEYDKRWHQYRLRLAKSDLTEHRGLLLDLIRRANGSPAAE